MERSWDRPLTIATLALGGQGGGVLSTWLVEVAEANGYLVQSTYVAGVAQRTGATVYCVEMFPRDVAERAGKPPVFTAYPIPGDVDLVIAGEMAEVGRAIEKGFVTPNLTTLVASTHRVYTMPEKTALGNGIMDMSAVDAVANKAARHFLRFDMEAAAMRAGSIISAVLLGAIAASGALPFPRSAFEDVIRQSGRAVAANLAGFAAGFEGPKQEAPAADSGVAPLPRPEGDNGKALLARVTEELPHAVADIAGFGVLRALDYQDKAYAEFYLERLTAVAALDPQPEQVTREVARQLALQMCYEDTIRVADLKTRSARLQRVRQHVAAEDDQPAHVIEYFHPRLEELADTLPVKIGDWLAASPRVQGLLRPLFSKGRNVRTTGIRGFLMLHSVAKLRRFRRRTRRYHHQQSFIDSWLAQIETCIASDYERALQVARSIEIVRGYGDTYARGLSRYERALAASSTATELGALRNAALADEGGRAFEAAVAALEANK